MYRNTYVHAYMHTHKQTYAYVQGYFHTKKHIHMCINTHTYICTHASIPVGASWSKPPSSADISSLIVFCAPFMTLKALRNSSSARSPVCVNVCRKDYFSLKRLFCVIHNVNSTAEIQLCDVCMWMCAQIQLCPATFVCECVWTIQWQIRSITEIQWTFSIIDE